MSNKTQLQTNNTKYASLIETLRGKAVGGGSGDGASVEMCDISLANEISSSLKWYYTDENFDFQQLEGIGIYNIKVPKNTMIAYYDPNPASVTQTGNNLGNIDPVWHDNGTNHIYRAFQVLGAGMIQYYDPARG